MNIHMCTHTQFNNTKLTVSVKAYSHVTIIVAVSAVLSVFIINLTRNSHFKPPPKLVCSLLQSWIAKTIFCLPEMESEVSRKT